MTPQESQELKTYLDQRFDGIDQRFDGIDQRLDGIDGRLDRIDGRFDGVDRRLDKVDQRLDKIDVHLDRQDIDFNKTTMNLLRTIDDATKESRRYAARLFGILDRPPLQADDAPKAVKPRGPKRPARTAVR
jgi:hypothetical protein